MTGATHTRPDFAFRRRHYSVGVEEDLSKKKSSKQQAADRSQAIVKWAGNEAAATGVSAAMVAVGVATVIPGAIAVREHRHIFGSLHLIMQIPKLLQGARVCVCSVSVPVCSPSQFTTSFSVWGTGGSKGRGSFGRP